MRKVVAVALTIIMVLSFDACGTGGYENNPAEQSEILPEESGNEERIAEQARFYEWAMRYLDNNGPVAYQLFREAGDYEDAQSYLEGFYYNLLWEVNDSGVYSYQYDANGNCIAQIEPDGKAYFYVYDDAGRLIQEGNRNSWDVEYEYDENGKLKRTKAFASFTNSADHPNYIITEYNSFGYPVKLENQSDKITWLFTYDCAEDGAISSVQCAMTAYSDDLEYTFNLEEFDGQIELCHGVKDKVLTFKSVSEDGTEIRMYGISYVNDEIILEELSYTKVDANGNPVVRTAKNLLGFVYTLMYENTYNGRGELIKVVQSSDRSNDIITYTYTFGYTYPNSKVRPIIRDTEDSAGSGNNSAEASVHTNQYGPENTPCSHAGCTSSIAFSGDTNCCAVHSWECLKCGCYVDENAMYCLACLNSYMVEFSGGGFTNRYGTPTTRCAHSGCDEYIASSGDTNCCSRHSNNCLNCGCYIDGDAMYCMSCIKEALN